MFVELEGPTALREDLVHALSLSLNVVQISGRGGSGRFCAALSAVWNGKLGSVAVLLHEVDGEAIRRFVAVDAASDENSLEYLVDAAIAFSESMGFRMDQPDFHAISKEEAQSRLAVWNRIRKPKRAVTHLDKGLPAQEGSDPITDPGLDPPRKTPEEVEDPDGCDPFEGWNAEANGARDQDASDSQPGAVADASSEEEAESDSGKAVLGKLSLVRKGAKPHPLSRLRSHF